MAKILVNGLEIEFPSVSMDNISDGFHTFNELYAHRCFLFAALMLSNKDISWKALDHSDGTEMYDGWFVAGMDLPTGLITYHLPINMWDYIDVKELDFGKWDGANSLEVIKRLKDWCKNEEKNN